ncbi:hypothetical protein BJ322DRAFT_1108004 [Thelephora terrestris]|uniref:Uncharacterized protein n=1 Tax=Thelephora terrestris TaxID=56493 RepID=A0A9P6HG12_9AGAM|nr:hypothetical protein BJ322DRAFT_1108004 [Thelephora terrestris]
MTAEWLPTELAKLLAAPHISFPNPPPNIHLGPGPIDLFSTYFNNIFATDVKSTVDGHKVSRDELKQKLLNLQKHWNPEKVKFEDDSSTPPDSSTVAVLSDGETVCFLAETGQQGGNQVIERFAMKGAASLFQ